MSDQDILIRAENVGKKFCRDLRKSLWYGVRDSAADLIAGKESRENSDVVLRAEEFWANQNVTFEVRRGQCLGLVGRNGAGKTTLLKMLNGLIKPDVGKIEVRGRVGALIALGAGFNPVLTGRENIYVNAAVLGLSNRQAKDRVEDIVDFADLEEFIDSPVRNYSSGMQVRLGFSIATVMDPDVLILDEVLAVGDASFRHKCYHRINKLMERSAVVLVSHSMDYIAHLSNSVGVMQKGKIEVYEDPFDGIVAYENLNQPSAESSEVGKVQTFYDPVRSVRIGVPEVVRYGETLAVEVELVLDTPLDDVLLSFVAKNRSEQPVMAWHTGNRKEPVSLVAGRQTICFQVDQLSLHAGTYRWNFCMNRKGSIEHIVWFMNAGAFEVKSVGRPIGNIPYLPPTDHLKLIVGDNR